MRVKGEGPVPCDLFFCGEGPGVVESKTGRPFVPWAPAGGELTRYLNGMTLPIRDEVYITNLFKEWAGGAPTKSKEPTQADLDLSEWELHIELATVQPKVVVTLGRWSTRWFLGDVAMDQCHGLLFRVAYCGRCLTRTRVDADVSQCWCGCPAETPFLSFYVLPVVHPAAGLHQPTEAAKTAYDLAQLAGILKRPESEWPYLCWAQSPPGVYTGGGSMDWPPIPAPPIEIGLDTEGSVAAPWGFSCSTMPGTGMVKRYDPEDPLGALSPECRWVLHHYMHDKKMIEAMGGTIPEESFDDTMVMAYLLGTEPQALKDLAWRHLGRVRPDFTDIFIKKEPCYGKHGNLLKKQKTVVLSMDEVDPQTVIDYAGADADDTLSLKPVLWKKLETLDLTEIYEVDRRVLPLYARMEQVGLPIDMDHMEDFRNWLTEELTLKTLLLQCDWPNFNPANPDQVAAIMFDHLGLPGGKKTPKKQRYSTNDKIMEALKGNPFVAAMIEWRELAKLKNTFIDPIGKYVHDGRLFFELLATRVVSGRLAAKNPNVLAFPKYTVLGKRFRRGIRALAGRRLGSWDLNQIELRVLALDSGSQTLIEMFNAGVDVHTRTARKIFGLKEGEKEVPAQRVAAKATNFGIPMGLTEVGLAEQMRKHGYPFPELMDLVPFHTVADERYAQAKVCQAWIEAVIADWGLEPYIKGKHAEARRFGYVRSMGGRIRFLPSVLSPNKQIREAAQREAQAYGPQAGARYVMKTVEARVWREVIQPLQAEGHYIEPLLDVHDDLLLEFEEGLGDLLLPLIESMVAATFDMAIPISAKGAVGQCWADL